MAIVEATEMAKFIELSASADSSVTAKMFAEAL